MFDISDYNLSYCIMGPYKMLPCTGYPCFLLST